jgi:hypothetical protein
MRFSAAIQPQPPLRTRAAAEAIRRLVSPEPVPRTPPVPVRADDLPADLDQRVRLVGEW